MKVLQINLICSVASTGKLCDSIAKYLIGQGHEVLNCSVNGLFECSYEYKYETKLEALYRRVCFKFFGRRQWQIVLQTRRLIRKIREFNPDIVHIHNIHHNVINLQLLFEELEKRKTSIVYTMHDMWAMTGGCFYDLLLNCSEKSKGCQNCQMILGNCADCNAKDAEKFLRLKKDLYEKQNNICFVAVSEWLKQQTDNSIISNFRREVIRNGINISTFKQYDGTENTLKKMCNGKRIVLSCASYWMERKGLYDLFELGRILGAEYQIVLVGNCAEDIKRTKTDIVFLDNINDADRLAQLYSEADVYVSLSKSETFGLTLAEAACCGTDVVAYDNTGMSEVLDFAGGIKVPDGNVEQVAHVIKEICHSPKAKNESEIKETRSKFSELEMCKAYVELYKTMI